MKKLICLLSLLVITIPFIFASGNKDKTPSGNIRIYTSMYEDVIKNVRIDLQRKFPKCNIEFVYGGTGRLKHMISTEKRRARLGCDILMVAEPAYSLELKNSGLLHSYMSKEAGNLAFDYDPDGFWYPVRVNNMVLAYNPARNQRNSVPNSFYDFAYDSRVRGALSMRNPNISGTSMSTLTALRDKYGYDYFTALGAQRVQIEYGTAEAIRKLETGEYKVIMILEESILQKRMEGSTLEVIYPADGTIIIPSTVMIINNQWSANRNTRTAEAIVDWFLSEEGQNAIVAGYMHSVRKDFPRIPFGSKPTEEIMENRIHINWENNLRDRDEIIHRFEEKR